MPPAFKAGGTVFCPARRAATVCRVIGVPSGKWPAASMPTVGSYRLNSASAAGENRRLDRMAAGYGRRRYLRGGHRPAASSTPRTGPQASALVSDSSRSSSISAGSLSAPATAVSITRTIAS